MLRLLLCAFALIPAIAEAAAEPTKGAELFLKNCQTCHSLTDDGVRRAGLHLQQVFGRQVGVLEGFPYSEALKGAAFSWDAEKLDAWLTNPQAHLPGTYMLYRQDDLAVRQAIISYLQAAAGGPE